MPIFDFCCAKCGHEMEILVRTSLDKETPTCVECGSTQLERLISAPNIPKEAAAAMTRCGKSSTCCGSPTPCDNPPCL